MHRHAFRSVCSRTRPELEQASDALQSCIRQFSTTQLQAADNNGPTGNSTPSLRERSRAATSEINSLARSRSPMRGGKAPSGPAGGPRVLDVKSLPRLSFGGRGNTRGGPRGGFTPRGGPRGGFTPRGGSDGSSSPSRFSPSRGGGRGGFRGRGGFGGRGGRGRGAKKFTGRRRDDDDENKDRKFRGDEFAKLDPDEQAFDDSIRFGTTTKYSPTMTVNTLADFAPVVPTSSAGKVATVLQNLSVLGTADHVGTPQAFQARHYATEIEQSGVRFFADMQSKAVAEEYLQNKNKSEAVEVEGNGEAEGEVEGEVKGDGEANAEAKPIINDTEDAVRKVILEKAINGQHETPKFALDPIGVSRSWHLRAETYTTKDVNSFENKLTSLLSKNAPKGGKKQAKA